MVVPNLLGGQDAEVANLLDDPGEEYGTTGLHDTRPRILAVPSEMGESLAPSMD